MKIKQSKAPIKKTVIIATASLVLVTAAIFIYLYSFQGNLLGWQPFKKSDSDVNYDKPTEEQKKTGIDTKENSVNTDDATKTNTSGSDQPLAPTPDANGKSRIDMTITSSEQVGTKLRIRSDISVVTAEGTCTLTLKNATQTITKTANVQALSSSSSCQGFDVPISELSPGTWEATLLFENNTLTASTAKQVTIQ